MSSRVDETGKHLERFLQDLKRHLPLLESETCRIKELQQKTDEKLLRDVQEENKKLYKEIEDLRKKLRALKETRQIEKKEREEAEREEKTNTHAELSEEIERLTRKCEDTNAVNDKFKEEMDVLIAEKRSLEETREDQKYKIKSLQRKVSEIEREKQNTQQLEAKYKKLHNKLEETNQELEETKLRLSELMGHKLSDKNPNIADLSDQNRPTKLGEMFSALYDDEYTDAFEEIGTGNDKYTCKRLLDLLMDAKSFCDDKAEEQLRALKRECLGKSMMSTSTDTSLLDYSLKEMKEIRKKNAKRALEGIYEKFVSHMTYTRYSTIFTEKHRYAKTIAFAKKCVELCWLMAVQDPPLVFGPLPQRRDKFNADLFREFTKSGETIDFPVWPVLHLYENGPVLSKGVVEPIKESWADNRTEPRSYRALDRDQFFDTENRQHQRDLGVDESSRPVSEIGTSTSQREVDYLFNTGIGRQRVGGHLHTGLDDLISVGTRHTPSVGYQQDTLPTSHYHHSSENYRNRPSHRQFTHGLHREAWKY